MAKQLVEILAELAVLSGIIFAAVAWLKSLGVAGNALTISAFVFGLVLGVAFRDASAPLVTFSDWFLAIVFGLCAGFMATGAYKGAEGIAMKGNPDYTPVIKSGAEPYWPPTDKKP